MIATQQYVIFGLRCRKCASPFIPVSLVSNGVPGRGLLVDFGVDASTGIPGAGVPRIVTKIVAVLIDGFGDGEMGGPDGGVEVEPPPLHAAIASAATARRISRRLGIGGSLRRLTARPRPSRPCKDESSVVIWRRAPHSTRETARRRRSPASARGAARSVSPDRDRRTCGNREPARGGRPGRPRR